MLSYFMVSIWMKNRGNDEPLTENMLLQITKISLFRDNILRLTPSPSCMKVDSQNTTPLPGIACAIC